MFSRCGKNSIHRYRILLDKDEILTEDLSAKVKKKTLIKFKFNNDPKPVDKILSAKTLTSKERPIIAIKSSRRDQFLGIKSETPPPGHYNCNYAIISKSLKFCKIRKNPKTLPKETDSTECNDSFFKYTPKYKLNSIYFEKQVPRKDFFVQELNENRFVGFESSPKVCSKYKQVGVPDFSKFSKRKSVMQSEKFLNSYNVGFSFVKEDLGKVFEFRKYSPRKPLFDAKEDWREYCVNWASVEKKSALQFVSRSLPKLK